MDGYVTVDLNQSAEHRFFSKEKIVAIYLRRVATGPSELE